MEEIAKIFNAKPILTTAITSSVITALGLSLVYRIQKQKTIRNIKSELSFFDKEEEYQELMDEQLSRNIAFLGKEGVDKVRKSFVIVVGLGGVGSHAAHLLVRSGVEHVRFIDFDQVTLSSLNRHAVATRKDVGIPKVIAMKNHLLQIVPHCNIEAKVELFELAKAKELLASNPDYVLDCIDHLETKAELIQYCIENKIRVISSMGAGAKADPSRIQVADISETFEDPLARSTRGILKMKNCHARFPVVYSTEKPGSVKLLPLEESKVEEADQYSTLPSFRSRILPVLGTIPALFGNAMCSHVLTELADFPTEPLSAKGNKRMYERFYKDHYALESKLQGKDTVKIYLTAQDLGFIFEDTWRGKSAIDGTVNDRLVMVRWDPTKLPKFGNIICLTKQEAQKHMALQPSQFVEKYGQEFVDYVQARFAKENQLNKYR
ncbi:hypothetical protein HK103_005971 [Boothiomyces macroporosus]|uniref:THIF-type NAD/FAD binding fold domain-containing protein n=1 Tax=Boothiomyces macroporosus TaxID=261099 RepID=A0AAD5UQ32_9FUNG|nr:hypothetical protein HK103_005971 [Boothiomyces macroporosus]